MYRVDVIFDSLQLTNSKEHSPSWKACSSLINEETASRWLQCSQESTTGPSPEPGQSSPLPLILYL